MTYFVIERPYVHLYLANKKRFMIAYLDNYKAVEMPKPLPPAGPAEETKDNRFKMLPQGHSYELIEESTKPTTSNKKIKSPPKKVKKK